MRPKLVFGVSLVSALLGGGSCIAIVFVVFSSLNPVGRPELVVFGTLLLPIAAITLGSVFVYRHTARRRKLQAFITAVLATILTLSLLLSAVLLIRRRNQLEPFQDPILHKYLAGGIQSNFFLNRTQCINHKTNVFIQIHT
jgi:hypothetical protein